MKLRQYAVNAVAAVLVGVVVAIAASLGILAVVAIWGMIVEVSA